MTCSFCGQSLRFVDGDGYIDREGRWECAVSRGKASFGHGTARYNGPYLHAPLHKGFVYRRDQMGLGLKPIRHGTDAGYQQHWQRDEAACRACLEAKRAADRARRVSA